MAKKNEKGTSAIRQHVRYAMGEAIPQGKSEKNKRQKKASKKGMAR